MSLKLKPFLTAALLVAAGVGPARASKRPPKGVWPLFPGLLWLRHGIRRDWGQTDSEHEDKPTGWKG